MKMEFLKELGIADDIIAKIQLENGKDVTAEKAKFADYEDIKAKLNAFEGMDIETIKKSAVEWKNKYDIDTKELTQKLQKQALDSKIDFALTNAKAKNITAAKALLKSDEIKFEGDKLIGLDEQLLTITKENPYLFGTSDTNPPPGNGGNTQTQAASLGGALTEHYKTN